MRKIDWTDYRQVFNENGMNHEQAVKKLSERGVCRMFILPKKSLTQEQRILSLGKP